MQRFLVSRHGTGLRRVRIPTTFWRWLLVLCALPPLLGSRGALAHPAAHTALQRAMQLAGAVPPPVLSGAAHLVRSAAGAANQPLTLTVVLRRSDEAAFEHYLAGVQDPRSPSYRQFLSQQQLAAQFGPSQAAYDAVLAWLVVQGFTLMQGSANRLTITVKGTRQVAQNILGPTSLAVDPMSGDLFVGNGFNGGPQTPAVVRIHDAGSSTPVDCASFATNTSASGCWIYAVPGEADSLAFDPDGSLYVRGAGGTGYANHISVIAATNSAQPGTVTVLDTSLPGGGGLTILQPEANGKRAVVAVGHNGSEIDTVDLNQSPVQPVTILTGSAGGMVGPDGCLYAGQANNILKLTRTDGTCPFTPAAGATPQILLSPAKISPNPGTGSPVTFTATLANVSNPQGTAILLVVGGANPQVKLVHADANGQATFTYTGVFTGADQVLATTTITSTTTVTPTTLTSNAAQVTWAPGKHVTFAGLNLSATIGQTGLPVTLRASLTDVTAQPSAPIGGAALTLQLATQSCVATTDSTGTGSCSIILDEAPGTYTLTASYAGSSQCASATATTAFVVTQFVGALVPLQAGWNLMDLPLTPTAPISASTVLAGVLHQSGGQLAAIYELTSNQWTPSLIQAGNGAPRGTDFLLQPGAGYLVYSDLGSSFREVGFAPATPPTWNLTQGWNLVGVSIGATGPISASTVLRGVVGKSGGQLVAIYGLSHTQWTPSLIQVPTGAQIGKDFLLQPGMGYLLYSDVGTSYMPGARAAAIRRPGAGGRGGGAPFVPPPHLPVP